MVRVTLRTRLVGVALHFALGLKRLCVALERESLRAAVEGVSVTTRTKASQIGQRANFGGPQHIAESRMHSTTVLCPQCCR